MNSNFWAGLIVGLIIGWTVEWIIDWLYWRKRYELLENALHFSKDKLQKIKGIGPIIEERLNTAGIFTFKQLSKLEKRQLEHLVGNAENLADEQDLIKQAKKLSKKKKGK